MKKSTLRNGLVGLLLLSNAGVAQNRDLASPSIGDADRGRLLLSILGPKPNDAAGISPLQQQELNRRVRCAATRQQIQDQLDFEAAGSPGFYGMAQLRSMEQQNCTSVLQQTGLQTLAPPPAVPLATYRPPVQQPSPPPPPQPILAQQPVPQRSAPSPQPAIAQPPPQRPAPPLAAQPSRPPPASPPQPLVQRPPQPNPPAVVPAATGPAYTPAPDYPADDKAAGHEGDVLIQLVINADGSVQKAAVAKSSNYPTLDAAALTAAKTWRIPAAAGHTIDVPLKFRAH
jgi:TonB family protein